MRKRPVRRSSLHHRLIPHVTPDVLAYPLLVLEELTLPRPPTATPWLASAMPDPDLLAGLPKEERLACRVAERVTGAQARAWDVPGVKGRDGGVDAFLDYPDGRTAAFEVTRIASGPEALQLENLLGQDSFEWPLPGQWWWDVWIRDVWDLPG